MKNIRTISRGNNGVALQFAAKKSSSEIRYEKDKFIFGSPIEVETPELNEMYAGMTDLYDPTLPEDGKSWETAFTDVQSAIENVDPNTTLNIAAGLYKTINEVVYISNKNNINYIADGNVIFEPNDINECFGFKIESCENITFKGITFSGYSDTSNSVLDGSNDLNNIRGYVKYEDCTFKDLQFLRADAIYSNNSDYDLDIINCFVTNCSNSYYNIWTDSNNTYIKDYIDINNTNTFGTIRMSGSGNLVMDGLRIVTGDVNYVVTCNNISKTVLKNSYIEASTFGCISIGGTLDTQVYNTVFVSNKGSEHGLIIFRKNSPEQFPTPPNLYMYGCSFVGITSSRVIDSIGMESGATVTLDNCTSDCPVFNVTRTSTQTEPLKKATFKNSVIASLSSSGEAPEETVTENTLIAVPTYLDIVNKDYAPDALSPSYEYLTPDLLSGNVIKRYDLEGLDRYASLKTVNPNINAGPYSRK